MGSQQNVLHQLVSFILGASAAAVLLFFLTTATTGARFTGISTWANGTTGFDDAPFQEEAPATTARVPAAPAHADAKVNSSTNHIPVAKFQSPCCSLCSISVS